EQAIRAKRRGQRIHDSARCFEVEHNPGSLEARQGTGPPVGAAVVSRDEGATEDPAVLEVGEANRVLPVSAGQAEARGRNAAPGMTPVASTEEGGAGRRGARRPAEHPAAGRGDEGDRLRQETWRDRPVRRARGNTGRDRERGGR